MGEMRVKTSLSKDKKIRFKFCFLESKIRAYKILINLGFLDYLEGLDSLSRIKYSANNLSKIKNKCFLSSRNRGIINKRTGLSRIKLKELTNSGLLLGFKKYSW